MTLSPRAVQRFASLLAIAVVLQLGTAPSYGTAAAIAAGATSRVSVSSGGVQGDSDSVFPSMSADGRFVAFHSDASNLVPGDTNGKRDTFVHDRQTGTTSRVSVSSGGVQGDSDSLFPSMSADGRFVAFHSDASNLVPGDTNGKWDTFVHDRQTGTTSRVSVSSGGVQGNGWSLYPSISADGRFVAFHAHASNLVPGDTNGKRDTFVHDRQTGTTSRVSVSSDGAQCNGDSPFPSISADGRFVAFESYASDMVPGDTNGGSDTFVHDRQTGATSRVSVSSGGVQGNGSSDRPSISADGRFVAFQSSASNLVSKDINGHRDTFVHDRQTGSTSRVSVSSGGLQGITGSHDPSISADGRFVAFWSDAWNLVPGDTNDYPDTFVHDRQTGTTSRVSLSSGGAQGSSLSRSPSISADGRHIAFESQASNLVPGDTNDALDIFVRDLGASSQSSGPPKKAIYVLPGYLGSRLYDSSGSEVWYGLERIKTMVTAWHAGEAEGEMLALDASGNLLGGSPQVSTNDKDRYGTRDEYKALVQGIDTAIKSGRLKGYTEVRFFPWDWRQDIDRASSRLNADIEARGYDKVVLVGHSTGGLLAADYVNEHSEKVEKAITLAAPLYGTFPSMQALLTGQTTDIAQMLENMDLGSNAEVKRAVFRDWIAYSLKNTPCSYQLLPSTGYLSQYPMRLTALTPGSSASPYRSAPSAEDMYALLNSAERPLNSAMLDGAGASHKTFRQTDIGPTVKGVFKWVPSLHLASTGKRTIVGTRFIRRGTTNFIDELVQTNDGDGTVPSFSGLAGYSEPSSGEARTTTVGLNSYVQYPASAGLNHGDMASSSRVISDAIDFVASGKVPNASLAGVATKTSQRVLEDAAATDSAGLMLKIEDGEGSAPSVKYIEVVDASSGSVIARLTEGGEDGWGGEFAYSVLDAAQTRLQVWIPASGYDVRLAAAPVEDGMAPGAISGTVATMDQDGARLGSASFEVSAEATPFVIECSDLGPSFDSLRVVGDSSSEPTPVVVRTDYSTGVRFTSSVSTVEFGTTVPFEAHSLPDGSDVSWASSDEEVLHIDEDGQVTAVGYGVAKVVALSADGNKTASIEVTVPYSAESIVLGCANPYLSVGEQRPTVASLLPEYATNRVLEYSSDVPAVASVDADGVVTGVSAGSATITARSDNGLTATIFLFVSEPPVRASGVAFDGDSKVFIRPHGETILGAHAIPENSTWPDLTWASSDAGVLSIEATSTAEARVLGIESGAATVTVTTVDGGFAASREVVVDGLAPTVVFEPASTYTNLASIVITAADNPGGAGVSAVSYRLNGGPTMQVQGKDTTVQVSDLGLHVLEAWAIDGVGNQSLPVTRAFAVVEPLDVAAPVTTLTLSPTPNSAGWNNTSVTVSLAAQDEPNGSGVAGIEYRVDSESSQPYSEAFEVSGEGIHQVAYSAVDVDGNRETTRTVPVRIDRTAPATKCEVMEPYVGFASIALSASDHLSRVAKTEWRISGGAWQIGSLVQVDMPGSYTLEYRSADHAGNVEPTNSRHIVVLNRPVSLRYRAHTGGAIVGQSLQTVAWGGMGTVVTAVPSTGYRFVSWSDGVGTATRTDTNVTADKSVTASFAIKTYALTYKAGSNGTISGKSPQTVNHGSSGTVVTAVPSTGYRFVSWSDGVGTATRTDANVTAHKSVTASFAIKTKVNLGAPVAPKTMKKSKSYTIYGSLKPKHTAGTKPVRIYKYKQVGKKWVKKGYVTAKAYNYKTYTRYKVKMKLTSKGKWRLRAYAPADSQHAAMWSKKYDSVTVK